MDILDIEGFSETVSIIYEAGLNPDRWPHAMQALCRHLDAEKAQMLYIDPADYYFSFACSYGFNPHDYNIMADRFRRYMSTDPIFKFGLSHPDQVFSDVRLDDKEQMERSYMQTEVSNLGMKHLLTSFICENEVDITGVCFFRGKNRSDFGEKEEQLLAYFVPHIKRASFIHKTVAGSVKLKTLQTAVLDHIQQGIILVNELHEVVVTNQKTRDMLNKSDALGIKKQGLFCKQAKDNSLLHQSIDEIVDRNIKNHERSRIATLLHSSGGYPELLAVSTAFELQKLQENEEKLPDSTHYYTARIPTRRHALITLCELNKHSHASTQVLMDLFSLTPAEAALAACLSEDNTLKEAAGILGRSVGTARIQLQSIFEKTETNRQASLVRLLMEIPY